MDGLSMPYLGDGVVGCARGTKVVMMTRNSTIPRDEWIRQPGRYVPA
jgi:hypothetical protein